MKNKIMKNTLPTVLILTVFACSVFALPPDPDNAALVYYQAFCLYEKPDDTMKDMIVDLASGKIEPHTRTTQFIESQKTVISLAATAAELPNCDWGLKYSEGLSMEMPYLSQIRHLARLIIADARTTASKGNYELAIDRCLIARKLAIQVAHGQTAISFLLSRAIERITNKCIQDILSSGPMELQTLQHLKLQWDELDSKVKPLEFFLETEQEVMAMYITPEKIREVLPWIDPENETGFVNVPEGARKYILNADKKFCQRNMTYYNRYWNAIFSALKLPYQQAYKKLKELEQKPLKDYKENPDAIMTRLLAPTAQRMYNFDVQRKTSSNALKAALEIYITNAKTGRLPDRLPAGLLKDLFSGKPFEYKKTADGFILRCQGEDLEKDEIHQYEFKIKQ